MIWEALKLSFQGRPTPSRAGRSSADAPLKHFLSWTTIGTPFIHRQLNRTRWTISGVLATVGWINFGGMILFGAIMTFAMGGGHIAYQLNWFAMFLLGAWITYVVLSGFVTSYDDGRTLRRETALTRDVLDVYGDKWYGKWSQDDEAIHGLRVAVHLEANVVTVGPLQKSPFVSHLWWYLVLRQHGSPGASSTPAHSRSHRTVARVAAALLKAAE